MASTFHIFPASQICCCKLKSLRKSSNFFATVCESNTYDIRFNKNNRFCCVQATKIINSKDVEGSNFVHNDNIFNSFGLIDFVLASFDMCSPRTYFCLKKFISNQNILNIFQENLLKIVIRINYKHANYRCIRPMISSIFF